MDLSKPSLLLFPYSSFPPPYYGTIDPARTNRPSFPSLLPSLLASTGERTAVLGAGHSDDGLSGGPPRLYGHLNGEGRKGARKRGSEAEV